jgi:hypothetical protein
MLLYLARMWRHEKCVQSFVGKHMDRGRAEESRAEGRIILKWILQKWNGGMPIPVVARSKAWFCGRSLTGIVGSNPTGVHGCLSLVSVVCCQVEVSATGWSLVQRSPTELGVSKVWSWSLEQLGGLGPYRAV